MKKYINTVSSFQFYQLVRYSTLIIIGIVFTKTAITQKEIGEYETFTFLAGAISFFWLTGLLKALLPVSSRTEISKTNLFSAFVIIQFLSIVAAIFLLLLQPFLIKFLLNGNEIPKIRLLVIFVVFSAPANLVEYFYLIKKKNKSLIAYSLVSFFIQLILVAVPAVLGYGIVMALKGLVLSILLRYIWLWIILLYYSEIHFSRTFIKEYFKLGGPLVVATLFSGSAQFIDGFIVTSRFDETTFAIFRYGARELPLAILLINALSNAMLAEFSVQERLKENLKKLKRSVTRLMHFLFPFTALLLLISHPVFPILFNPDFEKSATIFNIYLLLLISRLLMPQTILNGLKRSKEIMQAAFLELSLNVILSLIFAEFLGIAGIALATFIAYMFEKIYLSIMVQRKLNIRLASYLPVKFYLIYSAGILIIFTFAELIF